MKIRALVFFAVAAALLLVGAADALAGPGDLDPTFGAGGFTASALGASHAYSFGMAIGPNDRAFVSGIGLTSPYTMAVAAFNSSGALDAGGFNPNFGYVESVTGTGNTENGFVAAQPDGKVVEAGQSFSASLPGTAVIRYNASGSPDTGFGSGGTASSFPAGGSDPIGVLVESDGKILVVAHSLDNDQQLVITRLTDKGVLDPSYASGGVATLTVPGQYVRWRASALAPDGSVYVVGYHSDPSDTRFVTAKVTPGGALDPAFGAGTGYVLGTTQCGDSGLDFVAVQPDGRYVAAGVAHPGNAVYDTFTIERHNADGSLDGSFGSGGLMVDSVPGSQESWPEGLAVMPNGRIVAAIGWNTASSTTEQYLIARYLPGGQRDPTFGSGGWRGFTIPVVNPSLSGLALQSDGKIVLAGDGAVPPANAVNGYFLMRFQNDVFSPAASITRPARKKSKARKTRSFKGTAGPAGYVAKVEIALRRIDSKLLKKRKRCLWLSSPKAKFAKVKDPSRKCAPTKWRSAKLSATNWSYKLTRTLPKGKYRLYVRVTLVDGTATTTFSKTAGTLKSFALN